MSTAIEATQSLEPATFHVEPACECMACHLPLHSPHERVRWNLSLWFPGPYPHEGETAMLLCDPCKADWVDGTWDAPFDNFIVVSCTPVQ